MTTHFKGSRALFLALVLPPNALLPCLDYGFWLHPLFQILQQQYIFLLPRCLSLALFPVCHPTWTHRYSLSTWIP